MQKLLVEEKNRKEKTKVQKLLCTLAQPATEAGPTHLGPLSPSSCSRGVVAEIPRPWPRHAAVAAIPRLPDGYKGTPSPSFLPRLNPSRHFFLPHTCSLPRTHPKLLSPRHRHCRGHRRLLRVGGRSGGPRWLASSVPETDNPQV